MMTIPSDEILAAASANGDREAFDRLASRGRTVVAVLAATALRKDSDGNEYVYAQSTARDPGDSAVVPARKLETRPTDRPRLEERRVGR
jgi:hypothetical protein